MRILPLKTDKMRIFLKKVFEKFGNSEKSSTFAPAFRGMLLVKRNNCGNSSVGRAQPCQGWGRGSESRFPLNFLEQHQVFILCVEIDVSNIIIMERWRNW